MEACHAHGPCHLQPPLTQSQLKAAEVERVYPGVAVARGVSFEEIWGLFLDSGFLYPEKVTRLEQVMPEIQRTTRALLQTNGDLLSTVVVRDQSMPEAHLSALRPYQQTWMLQHLAALPLSARSLDASARVTLALTYYAELRKDVQRRNFRGKAHVLRTVPKGLFLSTEVSVLSDRTAPPLMSLSNCHIRPRRALVSRLGLRFQNMCARHFIFAALLFLMMFPTEARSQCSVDSKGSSSCICILGICFNQMPPPNDSMPGQGSSNQCFSPPCPSPLPGPATPPPPPTPQPPSATNFAGRLPTPPAVFANVDKVMNTLDAC
jgi:hypothetical protein